MNLFEKSSKESDKLKEARARADTERLEAEKEQAIRSAEKAIASELTEEEIDAGLERALKGKEKSEQYKTPDINSDKKIAA